MSVDFWALVGRTLIDPAFKGDLDTAIAAGGGATGLEEIAKFARRHGLRLDRKDTVDISWIYSQHIVSELVAIHGLWTSFGGGAVTFDRHKELCAVIGLGSIDTKYATDLRTGVNGATSVAYDKVKLYLENHPTTPFYPEDDSDTGGNNDFEWLFKFLTALDAFGNEVGAHFEEFGDDGWRKPVEKAIAALGLPPTTKVAGSCDRGATHDASFRWASQPVFEIFVLAKQNPGDTDLDAVERVLSDLDAPLAALTPPQLPLGPGVFGLL